MKVSLAGPNIVITLGVFFVCFLLVTYNRKPGNQGYEDICSINILNNASIHQDDPCILHQLRNNYMEPPSKENLNLEHPETKDPSMGQAKIILEILNNKKKGFFIECGALDGETRSNTLFMEQHLNWEGVLIEGSPENYEKLKLKHRKAWTIPACLSTTASPKTVLFKQNFNVGRISQNQLEDTSLPGNVHVQCFPIFSILSALNRTTIDYFSLDVEGDELSVLETIPWKSIHIQTLSVEVAWVKDGKGQVRQYMESQGYEMVKEFMNDLIFKKI